VITQTPRVAGITNDSTLNAASTDKTKVQIVIQYQDGLNRPMQTLQKQGSPLGYDMIQPTAYDAYGREITKYLPYTPQTGTSGTFRSAAISADQNTFYTTPPTGSGVTAIAYPYSQTLVEASNLGRPLEQGAPGVSWQLTGVSGGGHTVKMSYTLNNSTSWASDSANSRQVALYYTVINTTSYYQTLSRVSNSATYAANTLTVTISKDENWNSGRGGTMEEYKDLEGHVVLKRVYNASYPNQVQQLSTYYVYDDLGNLAFVLPPAANPDATSAISQATLDNLCYQYRYDELGRMTQKKIPGKGWEYTVYNTMDQPVATQDSMQRVNNQWIYSKYDALGRVISGGIWTNGGTAISRSSLQTSINSQTTLWETFTSGSGYSNAAWPTSSTTPLSVSYFDSYAGIPSIPSGYTAPSSASLMTRGMPVATKTAVLNTPADMLWGVNYYDDLGRSLKAYKQHYLAGAVNSANYDATSSTYDFSNAPTTATRQHWNAASTSYPLVTIANTYMYDHMGRKLKSWEQITNGSSSPTTRTLLSKTDYNEIGQLVTKRLHSTDSTSFFQTITYDYNERGWMLNSSASLFALRLYYNSGTRKEYSGNIAYQYWGTPGTLNKNYTYWYDKLNRLTVGIANDANNEQGIVFDNNGNITALKRYQAGTLIDSLAYTYTNTSGNYTNQARTINDGTTNDAGLKHGTWTYTYDGNGNQVTDPTKGTGGVTIAYNLLNLPQSVTGGKTITYTYDAGGSKLKRVSPNTGYTDYIGGIQYDGTTSSNGTLSFIQTDEGKAVPNGTGYDYEYYLGDNLGNTRVTFGTKTGAAVMIQQDDYYPFGFEISRYVLSPKNEYLYNRKELQEELVMYDYGARFYDPVIGRWTSVDPHAEKYLQWSPFAYGIDNPIGNLDFDGRDVLPSKFFLTTQFGKTFQDLRSNNKAFQGQIAKFENNAKYNLRLSIDDKKVKSFGAGAITQHQEGATDTHSFFTASIAAPGNSNYEYSQLGQVVVVGHEAIHEQLSLTGVKEDDDHNAYNKSRGALVDILKEYSTSNNLNLSDADITALSFSGQQNSKEFKSYIGGLAKQDNLSVKEEKDKYDNQVSHLVYQKKDENK
jgi:RHS repeat-associated protein